MKVSAIPFLLFILALPLQAQQMNYQGRLTNATGAAVTKTQESISFSLWTQAAAGTGTEVWGPFPATVALIDGRFSTKLGDATGGDNQSTERFLNQVFDQPLFLQMIVGSSGTALPRQEILPSPTSFYATESNHAKLADLATNATNATFATSAGTAANFTSVVLKTDEGNGRVGVGLANPEAKLHVWGDNITTPFRVQVDGSSKLTLATNGGMSVGGFQNTPPVNGLYVVGDVGIGTATPGAKLDVVGNAKVSGSVGIGTSPGLPQLTISKSIGANASALQHEMQLQLNNPSLGSGGRSMALGVTDFGTGVIQVKESGVGGENNAAGGGYNSLLLQPVAGAVIIGGTGQAKGKLEVSGSVNQTISASTYLNHLGAPGYTYYNNLGNGGNGDANVPLRDTGSLSYPVSIYASHNMAATGFAAFSDARIKRIKGRSDAVLDLTTLLNIEVTDYSHIDTVAKGARQQKKVIAQQIEKIFPQAVNQSTDVIPDIYKKGELKDGWVQIATSLEKGERVRLIGDKEEGIHEVLEVRDGAFRTAFKPSTDEVFVYGREVKDFRSVDYDAIAMLNVSATQELYRRLQTQETELTAKTTEISSLQKRLTDLETKAKAREARFAKLESMINAHPKATPVTRHVSATR